MRNSWRRAFRFIFPAAVVAAAAWFFLSRDSSVTLQDSRLLLGTLVDIQARFPGSARQNVLEPAWEEISRIEHVFSEYREESVISRINRRAGISPVEVPPEVFDLVRRAVRTAASSRGAFDPTWASLVADPEGWRIDPEHPRIPGPEVRERLAGLVDYRSVLLREGSLEVFLPVKGMALGLGGMAKGYAVDRAVAVLIGEGAVGGIVNAGGDLRAFGRPEGRNFWVVGVRDPFRADSIIARLKIAEGAVTTSGNYERKIVVDGKSYHHIFDPRTAMPVRGMAGVTVLAPDAVTADTLATAVFVLGWEEGRAYVESLPEAEAVLVSEAGERAVTSGLKGKVEFLNQ